MLAIIRFTVSMLIMLAVKLPVVLVSAPVVAVLLLTKWDGRTTVFGNEKHGRATDHYLYPTRGEYWREFIWLVVRNPVYNLNAKTLSVIVTVPEKVQGNVNIGDKIAPGCYAIEMRGLWEYYIVMKYSLFGTRRCLRARVGWKINGVAPGDTAAFVFTINPFKDYSGV